MKKSILALSLATICGYASAQAPVISETQLEAYEDQGYIKVVYLLKEGTDLSVYSQLDTRSEILNKDLYQVLQSQRSQASELEDRLLRYRSISFSPKEFEAAQDKVAELMNDSLVELAYISSPIEKIETITEPEVEQTAIFKDGENIEHLQYYLNADSNAPFARGVDARFAWNIPGGTGENVDIVSVEGAPYFFGHEDLQFPFATFYSDDLNFDEAFEAAHDTQSVGVMTAKNNGIGVTGIAHNADQAWGRLRDGETFTRLALALEKGSVIQCSMGSGDETIESDPATFDAIKYLTHEKGIHVVLSAGNESSNLDDPRFGGRYDTAVRDSGSIIVGATNGYGEATSFSNYGDRINVNANGHNVATTTTSAWLLHSWYTDAYSGTSSAAPIVAGAVAVIQSILNEYNLDYTPLQVRALLEQTGNYLYTSSRDLGPKPDIRQAVEHIFEENGITPESNFIITDGVKTAYHGDSINLDATLFNELSAVSYEWAQVSGAAASFNQNTVTGELTLETSTLLDIKQDLIFEVTAKDSDDSIIATSLVDVKVMPSLKEANLSGDLELYWGTNGVITPNNADVTHYMYEDIERFVADHYYLDTSVIDGKELKVFRVSERSNEDATYRYRVVGQDVAGGETIVNQEFAITIKQMPFTTNVTGNPSDIWGGTLSATVAFEASQDIGTLHGTTIGWRDPETKEVLATGSQYSIDTTALPNENSTISVEVFYQGKSAGRTFDIWSDIVNFQISQNDSISNEITITGNTDAAWGDLVTLNGTVYPIAPSDANYIWEQVSGDTVTLTTNKGEMSFDTTELPNDAQTLSFKLTIKDAQNAILSSKTQEVTVTAGYALDITGTTTATWGNNFVLNAGITPAPEGNVRYVWEQTSGRALNIQSSGSQTTISTSDQANAKQTFGLTVKVYDSSNKELSQTPVVLTLEPVAATGGPSIFFEGDSELTHGEQGQLTAQIHNFTGDVTAYAWNSRDTSGNSLNNALNLQTDFGGTVTFSTVGLQNVTQTIQLGVAAIDAATNAPAIIQWYDVTINEAGEVALELVVEGQTDVDWGTPIDVSVSLNNGYDNVAYQWNQVAGSNVYPTTDFDGNFYIDTSSLENTTQSFSFEAMVIDRASGSPIHFETIDFTVNEAGATIDPSVTVTGNTMIDWGSSTTLTAIAADTADATIEYRWTQISGETANLTVDAQAGTVVVDSSSMTNANATIGMQVDVIDTATGDVLATETASVTVNEVSTGGGDIPVWVAGQTDPETGDIFSHNGSCWEALNNPGSWEEPREGWFWTEVECE
ncbi:S8 family serine peptidase [Vibrio sp.]|nr:S8 family serine peptidase [Vibrio sp.]